jgi:hypothetical protein
VALADDRDRKIYRSGLTVEVENHLPKAAWLGDDTLDVLDRGVALPEPRLRFGDVRLERPRAPDAPAYGMVQLGLAGKRPDQRIELPGQQTVEERHGYKVALPLLLDLLQRRRREQLGDPRHRRSVPYPGEPKSLPPAEARNSRRC